MEVQWKKISDISGMESYNLYSISTQGQIRNDKTGEVRTGFLTNGYLYTSLNNQMFTVHRLVALAFIPNPDNLPEVNHKDEDKTNPNVDNLEWCTHEYNINYGTRTQRQSESMKNKFFGEKNPMFGDHRFAGKNNPMYGKSGSNCPSSIPVVQLDLQGNFIREYNNMKLAKSYGFDSKYISLCCRGKKKSYNGYLWKFKTDYDK